MKSDQIIPARANQIALYYISFSIAIGVAGSYINHLLDATGTEIPYLVNSILLGCFVIWIGYKCNAYTPNTMGFKKPSWFSTLSLFMWLSIVGEGITAFVLAWFPEPMVEVLIAAFTPESLFSLLMFTVMAVILAPVGEEIVFRGFIFKSYSSSVGIHRGVWLSALLFGLAHHSPPHVVAAFFSGLVFARFIAAGGSLWVSIIAHAMINLSSTLMMHFNQSPLMFPDYETTPSGGITGLGVAILASALYFYFHPISRDQIQTNDQPIMTKHLAGYLLITFTLLALDIVSSLSQPSIVIPAN